MKEIGNTMNQPIGKSRGKIGHIEQNGEINQPLKIFEKYANNSPMCIYIAQDGRFQYVNPMLEEISGYSKQELIGNDHLFYIHPDDRETAVRSAEKLLKNKFNNGVHRYQYRITCKTGELKWINETVAPILYKGKMATTGSFIDVTENKRVATELFDNEAKYRNLFEESMDAVFISTCDLKIVDVNKAMLSMLGYAKREMIGKPVHNVFVDPGNCSKCQEELKRVGFIRECDIKLRKKDGTEIDCVIAGTIRRDKNDNIVGFQGIIRDVTSHKRLEEESKQRLAELTGAIEGSIQAIATMAETRDPYTAGHQQRVAKLVYEIAKIMSLPDEQVEIIRVAGLLHDIGKISTPSEILSKPGKLSEEEMMLIRKHPQAGREILKTMKLPWLVCPIVLQHHERINGSGYPKGLSGEDIVLGARILAVADVVEAMASHRPYRPALGVNRALKEISQNKDILYDKNVVEACIRLFTEKRFKFD